MQEKPAQNPVQRGDNIQPFGIGEKNLQLEAIQQIQNPANTEKGIVSL